MWLGALRRSLNINTTLATAYQHNPGHGISTQPWPRHINTILATAYQHNPGRSLHKYFIRLHTRMDMAVNRETQGIFAFEAQTV
jgi:hypothetical protein